MRSRDTTGSLNVSKDSPHKMMGRMLAQRVTDEVLRGEMEEEGVMSTFQEMQILLANKEQVGTSHFKQDFETPNSPPQCFQKCTRKGLL